MNRPVWFAAVLGAGLWGGGPAAFRLDLAPVHEVRMLLTDRGAYAFDPPVLTIHPGDRVRWINVSGGPHNVAFVAESLPSGAPAVLAAAMTERLGAQPLVGKLLFEDGEVYEISFVGAPEGRYPYVCTPHEMIGMRATLTVAR
jgi:plastocyanin